MSVRVRRNAFLNTRVSLLASQLLPPGQIAAVIQAPVERHVATLRQMGLASVDLTAPSSIASLDLRFTEVLLTEIHYLARPLHGTEKDFFLYWMHRFELANLKALLRGKLNEQATEVIARELTQSQTGGSLDLNALLAAETTGELLQLLARHRDYADIAQQVRRAFELHQDPFFLDATIDRRYYAGLQRRADGLAGKGGDRVRELVGRLIDRINLVWLMRYRFAYGLSPAEAFFQLIPGGWMLGRERLLSLAELASVEAMVAALPDTYGQLLLGLRSATRVRDALHNALLRVARQMLRHAQFDLARVYAYLLVRESDLRRIAAVLKGGQLGVEAALIRDAVGLGEDLGAAA